MLLWRPSGARGSRSGRGRARAWHLRRLALSLVAAMPPRASCSACLSPWQRVRECGPQTRNQRPSHRSPSSTTGPSRLAEGSSTLRGGALDNALSRRCAISTPRGAKRLPPGSLDTLHAVDATHTRWATPTTASSSARTCYLQLALPIMKTARRRPTLRVMYHLDMLHREARRSCSTNIKSL